MAVFLNPFINFSHDLSVDPQPLIKTCGVIIKATSHFGFLGNEFNPDQQASFL
jgi:hypothetical protein